MSVANDRLDRYWAEELGCSPGALHDGGIHICAPYHRDGPRWMGWLVPVECLALASAPPGAGVISVIRRLADPLSRFISTGAPAHAYLPPDGIPLRSFLREYLPNAFPKTHRVLHCQMADFRPAPEVYPVSELPADDIHASWYRMHFDGPVFVARGEQGDIVSWAAIKRKSDDVWEMAVVTESPYRGRGLARSVVSRATAAALDAGKEPLYLHEPDNTASAKVCETLGYRLYGHELTCELGRIMPARRDGRGGVSARSGQ